MAHVNRRGFVISGAAVIASSPATAEYKGYETPLWRVVDRDGPFEVRYYEPYLAAEVTIEAGPDAALRQGFRTLAGYIFGDNAQNAKMSMTTPVTRQPALEAIAAATADDPSVRAWTIRFVMPREYEPHTLPRPENAAIRIVSVDPELRAVVGFSGMATQARLARAESDLLRWTHTKGLRATGPTEAAWFDDPFTLPWRRRNEVSLSVSMS